MRLMSIFFILLRPWGKETFLITLLNLREISKRQIELIQI